MIVVILAAAAIAMALLGLRQQRLATMHRMARLHANMTESRQMMWDLQVRIAEASRPATLQDAAARTGLQVEPLVTGDPASLATVDSAHGGHVDVSE
jgi:cell division protein FtsL